MRKRVAEVLDDVERNGDAGRSARAPRARRRRVTLPSRTRRARGMREAMRVPGPGFCAKREENATTAPASRATSPPRARACRPARNRSARCGSPARRSWSARGARDPRSQEARRRRAGDGCRSEARASDTSPAPRRRASGSKPLGTTSAALGKRAWNLNAIGIIDCAVAPQPCRKTNR